MRQARASFCGADHSATSRCRFISAADDALYSSLRRTIAAMSFLSPYLSRRVALARAILLAREAFMLRSRLPDNRLYEMLHADTRFATPADRRPLSLDRGAAGPPPRAVDLFAYPRPAGRDRGQCRAAAWTRSRRLEPSRFLVADLGACARSPAR